MESIEKVVRHDYNIRCPLRCKVYGRSERVTSELRDTATIKDGRGTASQPKSCMVLIRGMKYDDGHTYTGGIGV